jgi:hypothetical protein
MPSRRGDSAVPEEEAIRSSAHDVGNVPGGECRLQAEAAPHLRRASRRGHRRRASQGGGRAGRPVPMPNGPSRPPETTERRLDAPLSVYISTDSPPDDLLPALAALMRVLNLRIEHEGVVERGSWFKSWRIREARAGALNKVVELADKLERAGELKYIYGQRAESDEREANAVSAVIQSLAGVENAVIQLSSMIIVKHAGIITARVLSEDELATLRKHPELLKSPGRVLNELSELSAQGTKDAISGSIDPSISASAPHL